MALGHSLIFSSYTECLLHTALSRVFHLDPAHYLSWTMKNYKYVCLRLFKNLRSCSQVKMTDDTHNSKQMKIWHIVTESNSS